MEKSTSTTVPSLWLTLERALVHSTVGRTRRSVVEWYQTGLGSSTTPVESRFPLLIDSRVSIVTGVTRSTVWTGERASHHPRGPTDVRYPMLMMRWSRSTSLWLEIKEVKSSTAFEVPKLTGLAIILMIEISLLFQYSVVLVWFGATNYQPEIGSHGRHIA